MISKIEQKVLNKLYKDYKQTGRRVKRRTIDIFKEFRIKDGAYVGTLNSSKYIDLVLDGTHESFIINDEGIRYMESQGQIPKSIGILNKGRRNVFINNKFLGLDIGIQDEGEETFAAGNRLQDNKKPKEKWYQKWWGILILGIIVTVVGGIILNFIL